jgi:plastocyanin
MQAHFFRRLVIAAFAAWVATGGAAAALEETPQRPPTSPVGNTHVVTVEKGMLAFTPQTSEVKVGDIVKWINKGEETHLVVTQDPKGSTRELLVYKTLAPGETYAYQFRAADTYNYFCAIHFQMWGTVTVTK